MILMSLMQALVEYQNYPIFSIDAVFLGQHISEVMSVWINHLEHSLRVVGCTCRKQHQVEFLGCPTEEWLKVRPHVHLNLLRQVPTYTVSTVGSWSNENPGFLFLLVRVLTSVSSRSRNNNGLCR